MQNTPIDIDYKLSSLSIKGLSNYTVENNKQLTSLLCLHGWLDNAASFVPLMPYLNDFKVLAIDLPGHGCSSHRSAGAHYHFIDYVYDLLELFELNQWPAMDIVAHSMGGMIASAFAAVFPEKVKSLTLIDSIGFLSEDEDKTTENLRTGLLSRFKIIKKQQMSADNKKQKFHSTIDSAIEARMNVSDLHYASAKLLVERGIIAHEQGLSWRSDNRLRARSPLKLTLAQAEQIISTIKTPVQVIHGDNGFDMVKSGIKHYQGFFTQLEIHTLTGGHHVHMEQPQATAALIKQFISVN
jgi:pimeloyl-ACP methyl ester carboxylesterase